VVRRCLVLLLAFFALAACGGAETPEQEDERLSVLELVEELREGGYVVYIRHTATDMSQKDTHKTDVSRCDGMRNLTDAGREQARELGRAFRELEIPVAEVLASEYCRTRETAQLAFGEFRREPRLTGFPPDDPRGPYEARVRATRELLGSPPPEGRNTVLVAHVKNLEAAADVEIEEGDSAVFQPFGGSRFRYLGRVPVAAWPRLVEQLTED
jgi:phosphohistidine phosphatase SixA